MAGVLTAATVPDDFQVRLVTTNLDQPKGLDAPLFRAGVGSMGGKLFVAESGADRVLEIDLRTGDVDQFALTGSFPVGVGCYGGPFGAHMYIGNASGSGVVTCDPFGLVEPFALMDKDIAGLDFGKGQFGNDLYAGEWAAGKIWRVDRFGNEELFAELPGGQTRYLKFSHGGQFGQYLYFTDFATGDINRIDPDGNIEFFANTGTSMLEGLAFSPGGAFGKFLYVGDLGTGEIFRIDAQGNVELWADGFEGVADIIFKPGKRGGFTMFFVDGQMDGSLYEITLE
ncbi:MAG: NHL repeat-containing protein [Planctomycetota bacterium]